MARQESDREDLLREATALVERVEIVPVGAAENEHIVAGFRANGAASFFFGSDPVYQFNAAGALRRAYRDGQLIKASRGRLVSMARKRLESETQLLSRELNDAEQAQFIKEMRGQLNELAAILRTRHYTLIGQVPDKSDVVGRAQAWLAGHDAGAIAMSARAGA